MKILLVNPTRVGGDSFSMPPVHLMYLQKALKKVPGWSCEIVDVNYDINKSLKLTANLLDQVIAIKKTQLEDEYIKKISQKDFDILGIGGIVPCYNFSERLIKEVSRIKPDTWIVIGGGLGLPLKSLWFKTKVDFLVESDGELTIVDIVNSYPDKKKLKDIKGVYYREGDSWKGTPPALPANLDYIAYPDWEDIDCEYFISILRRWTTNVLPGNYHDMLKNARLLPVVITRGCPYSCTFCFHFNRLHRKHSIEYTIDYLSHLKKRFGIDMIQTWDDLIITDRKWFLQLCEALKNTKMNLKIFMSGGKPNLIDPDMARKMKEAGVIRISYGIESGSPAILEEMRKMSTVQENYNAVKWTAENGIFTHLNMVVGMPSETERTLKETRRFLMDLQKDVAISSENVSFSFATAYPGAALFDYATGKGLAPDMRRYVVENKGVGNYSLDFCGLGERRLKKFVDKTLIEMDFNELWKKMSLPRMVKLLFIRIPKFIAKNYLPNKMAAFLRRYLGYREYRAITSPKQARS